MAVPRQLNRRDAGVELGFARAKVAVEAVELARVAPRQHEDRDPRRGVRDEDVEHAVPATRRLGHERRTRGRQVTDSTSRRVDPDLARLHRRERTRDARRLVARLGEFDLVIGARPAGTQATQARRIGNATLNRLASYLTGRDIPDLTSGFRAARRECLREFLHLLPNGFSTPTTTCASIRSRGSRK